MRNLSKLGLATALLLALSACGGGSHHDATPPVVTPPPPPPPPVSMVDAFYTAVLALIGDGSETTTEPVAIESVAVTTPEDTEPVALK